MILLITPSARGQECAATVRDATGEETQWAENLPQAVARLREQSYSAVVLDQFLLENEPAESDQVLEHLGTAFPVYLNFAVSGMERLLREVRSALHRRKREETQARRSVEQQIRSEVCESSPPCCSPANWRWPCLRSQPPPRRRSGSSTISR